MINEKQPSEWSDEKLEEFYDDHRYDDYPSGDTMRLLKEHRDRKNRE